MTDVHQPASRRPIAGIFRLTAHAAVRACLRLGISADAVSVASVVFSAGAAVCFWQSGNWPALLIPAVLLCYLRLWCNMLDGMVALAGASASPRGEILNDLPDRVSDIVIFVGVAHSGLCQPLFGYWAALLALLTAYVGTLGQAVGVQREFSGLMSKPWRMVWLNAGTWTLLALMWLRQPVQFAGLTVVEWTLLVIIGGCVQTVVIRLARIFRALRHRPPRQGRGPS